MTLKIYKYILIAGFLLLAAGIVISAVTKQAVFGYIGFGAAVVTVILGFIFNRCPYCGRFLGRTSFSDRYCPGCGSELER